MRFQILLAAAGFLAAQSLGFAGEQPSNHEAPQPAVPNVLDCGHLSWLENCDRLNQQLDQAPGAPLRALGKNGLEFNFPPGTPSVVMEHTLNPTPQSAKRVNDYYAALHDHAFLAARLVQEDMERRTAGGPPFITAPHPQMQEVWTRYLDGKARMRIESGASLKIDFQNLRVFGFFDPSRPESAALYQTAASLSRRYPQLDISLLQISGGEEATKRAERATGMPVRVLEGTDRDRLVGRLRSVPEVWVQAANTNVTKVVSGDVSVPVVEQALAEASR